MNQEIDWKVLNHKKDLKRRFWNVALWGPAVAGCFVLALPIFGVWFIYDKGFEFLAKRKECLK